MSQDQIDRLTAQVTQLQAAVDASQEREATQDATDAATITALTEQRDALQAIIDEGEGATNDQLSAIVDGLDTILADVTGEPAEPEEG